MILKESKLQQSATGYMAAIVRGSRRQMTNLLRAAAALLVIMIIDQTAAAPIPRDAASDVEPRSSHWYDLDDYSYYNDEFAASNGLFRKIDRDPATGVDDVIAAKNTTYQHLQAIQSQKDVAEFKLNLSSSVNDVLWQWKFPYIRENIDAIIKHSRAILMALSQLSSTDYGYGSGDAVKWYGYNVSFNDDVWYAAGNEGQDPDDAQDNLVDMWYDSYEERSEPKAGSDASDCLSVCIGACPADPAALFTACVKSCGRRCGVVQDNADDELQHSDTNDSPVAEF